MLTLISSIPTTVREGFDLQELPPRASSMSAETLAIVFGGEFDLCSPRLCRTDEDCVRSVKCRRCIKSPLYSPFGRCGYR